MGRSVRKPAITDSSIIFIRKYLVAWLYGGTKQEEANKIVKFAYESGINFFDTAPWYGQGVSETTLGIALKNVPREQVYVATKVRLN